MEVDHCIAPSYAELRPLKPRHTDIFPVYDHLVDRLLDADTYPDDDVAFVMAVCSAYAYSDAATVAMIMTRLGLEKNHCLMVAEYVDALLLTSASFLVQSEDGRVVILCYRGTPPTSAITWLTDLAVDPVKIKVPAPTGPDEYVHGGFYRNVRSTRYALETALTQAIEGRSVLPDAAAMPNRLQALYITGHSLGGASAAMLATMLLTEPAFQGIAGKLKAVYTYGAPMIGSPEFADACNDHEFLRRKMIRYVYESDIVPQLPPRESGPFRHFGVEYQYKRVGRHYDWHHNRQPRRQLRSLLALAATPLSFLARQIRVTREIPFHASINDHLPQYYIDKLTPPHARSEFGD